MHVLSPVFQASPVEGLEHDCDAGSVVVHTENISSRPTLDHLKFLYVFLSVRVPHITGILYWGGGGGEYSKGIIILQGFFKKAL